jgi:hypothetical protein
MVEYGNILKKHGWDGTAKGLTKEIIDKSRHNYRNPVKDWLPDDVRQLLENIEGAKEGSKKWYEIIKKTIPYAWAAAPVAVGGAQLNQSFDFSKNK